MNQLAAWIRGAIPGTKTIQFQGFGDGSSFLALQTQVPQLADSIRNAVAQDPASFSAGYDPVCHSQGALLCRTLVEYMDDHKVHTLVSLAGPQMGVYGERTQQLVTSKLGNDGVAMLLKFAFYSMVYTPLLQAAISVANMWHDPTRAREHLSGNEFLPLYNGLIADAVGNKRRKANFLRLAKAVFVMGDFGTSDPFDGNFGPWQSGVFGYHKEGSLTEFVSMEQTKEYQQDTFGLKTMNEAGRLIRNAPSRIDHAAWVNNYNVVRAYVLPHLGDCTAFPTTAAPTTTPVPTTTTMATTTMATTTMATTTSETI